MSTIRRGRAGAELSAFPFCASRRDLTANAVIICYEIVQEFAQLYRSYRKVSVAAMADAETLQMAASFHSAAE